MWVLAQFFHTTAENDSLLVPNYRGSRETNKWVPTLGITNILGNQIQSI